METMNNYRRFYALYRRFDVRGDREDCRKQLVLQYMYLTFEKGPG